ncbi:MAG: SIS domain-containing protein, partial [Spirochaetes bacterium]
NNILGIAPNIIKDISSLKFNRAVFLGDSENYGTAIESHLKLQELTSGKVMCGYDTFPGLRHGPEAVIDDNTIVVAYLSLDTYTRKYEKDLLKELKDKQIGKLILLVADKIEEDEKPLCNYYIEFDPDNAIDMKPYYTPPVYIIVGQLLGLFKSLNLGLKPDNPSEDGVINRVVKGVKVYDYNSFKDKKIFNIIAER